MQHGVEERHVGARLHLQVDVRPARELGLAGVGHNERRAAFVGPLDGSAEHRVRLGGVRAGDEDDVGGVLHLAHRARGGRGIERALHRRDRRGMAQTRAVIDVVGAERGAEHPHHEVVLLVRALGRGEACQGSGAALAFQAQELLRRELEGLIPRGLAERLVPGRRGRDPVPNVQVHALQQRQVAHRLSHRARRARRLRVLALPLDGLPRPAPAIRTAAPAPDPAAPLLLPALADQRLREAIVVLGKVVTEPALHARRALVGSVELDVRRGDAHDLVADDVQIHLAADAAVGADRADRLVRVEDLRGREPLARHHLEDRARRAYPHTLAAPRAARLVRVAVRAHDDLGVLTPLAHVQHAHHLDVLARPYAARAQDARAHVVPDHRVAGPLVAMAQHEVALPERRGTDSIAHDVLLELVASLRPASAAVPQVLTRIALEQQPEHALAVFDRRMGLGLHHHPVRHFGGARREQLCLPLHRHQADAAIPDYGQLGIPAQGGDVQDPRGAGRFEDRLFGVGIDGAAVEREGRHDP